MIIRPSLIDNLSAKFNDPKSGYDKKQLIRKTHDAVKNGWYTNMFNEYPSLLCKKDMLNLIYRFLDLIRTLPKKNITEDFQINGHDALKTRYDKFITDIVRIGAAELFEFEPYADENNFNLKKKVRQYLQLDTPEFKAQFQGHASEALVSYLGTVLADIYKVTMRYIMQYQTAYNAWNAHLKTVKQDLVLSAMSNPSNIIDLADPEANRNRNLYYLPENLGEAGVAAGLTLFTGVVGAGAFVAYKVLTPNEFEVALDEKPTP